MAEIAPRYTVTVERLDGGEAIEEMAVTNVSLIGGLLRIVVGTASIFAGDAWSWLEVRRIEDEAGVIVDYRAPPKAKPSPSRRSLRTKSRSRRPTP